MDKRKVLELSDNGICPTCYDREHNHIVYGDNKNRMLFENDILECFLEENPRSEGHTIIITKQHYKDMMETPDIIVNEVFIFAKKCMNILKNVYEAESVYLCTMCDGLMNHFHIQLIPRYSFEKRGAKNFVKERKVYEENIEKIIKMRNLLKNDKNN